MTRPTLAFALFALCAVALAQQGGERVVAHVFGEALTAAGLRWADGKPAGDAVAPLRQRVIKEATQRFVAANRLEATDADLAAYARFDAEFQRAERARRAEQKRKLEAELQAGDLDPAKRQALEKQREVLASLEKFDAERAATQVGADSARRVWGPWITGYKANKALYEKYGGRVGITKWGPEPTGAIEALLREHERKKEFEIVDPGLAREFWAWYAAQPRFQAKPEQIDFTYYWLKPVKRDAP